MQDGDQPGTPEPEGRRGPDAMPRWVPRAIVLFWLGALTLLVGRWVFGRLHGLLLLVLIALFLSLAIEPGVNALARRGWRRGSATGLVLFGVFVFSVAFVAAIGTLVGQQVADLLENSDRYVDRTVEFLNDNFGTELDAEEVKDTISDPNGPVQEFITSQSDEALRLSASVLGGLLQAFSVLLFTFYLVADGPRFRRTICSRLPGERQARVLEAWDLAIAKTGGYLYSRAILAVLSAFFHWAAFTVIGVPYALALAVWVGLVSQFLPVVGTYLAGILPLLVTLVDDPLKALWVLGFVVVYQQVENYLFAPRITARTLELHPALAFFAALAGAAVLGPIGAILALPFTATVQAFASQYGRRHELIDDPLMHHVPRKRGRRRGVARP